jgi:hypothetical protein
LRRAVYVETIVIDAVDRETVEAGAQTADGATGAQDATLLRGRARSEDCEFFYVAAKGVDRQVVDDAASEGRAKFGGFGLDKFGAGFDFDDSTWMDLTTALRKPSFSTVTEYVPTVRSGNTYVPALEAVAVLGTFVASFVTVTRASSIEAPVLSVTVTRRVPSRRCARSACVASRQDNNTNSANLVILTIGASLLKELLWGRKGVRPLDLDLAKKVADPSQPYAGKGRGIPRSTKTNWYVICC